LKTTLTVYILEPGTVSHLIVIVLTGHLTVISVNNLGFTSQEVLHKASLARELNLVIYFFYFIQEIFFCCLTELICDFDSISQVPTG